MQNTGEGRFVLACNVRWMPGICDFKFPFFFVFRDYVNILQHQDFRQVYGSYATEPKFSDDKAMLF